MFQEPYSPLVVASLVALGGWLVAARLLPDVWPREAGPRPTRGWIELGIALLACMGAALLAQLWLRGIHLPEDGALGPVLGAIDQLLIYAPILLVPVLRHQPPESAWLPRRRIGTRLGTGLVLTVLAVTGYCVLRAGADRPWVVLGRIGRYDHLDDAVRILLEDVTCAILFVRLEGAVGRQSAIPLVAGLFALADAPALLAPSATVSDLGVLVRDVGTCVVVLLVLRRSRDVLWFWVVHFGLGMTQVAGVTGAG